MSRLNNEISRLLCKNNSNNRNNKNNKNNKNNSNNTIIVVNTNLEQFINQKLSGSKISSVGFYTNGIFNENKFNQQLGKNFIRGWDNIEINKFRIKNNKTNKKIELVNMKLDNFLSSFTTNEELRKKYRINIKLFLQQSSQFDIIEYIKNILKINVNSIIYLSPLPDKFKSKIYKNDNSILTKNIYEYYISTVQLSPNINICNVQFIYNCNHTKNKLKGIIKFNWKTKNIKNFMNIIIKNNIAENIINKLYEKIFCKEQITNIAGQKVCSLFYNTIEDIDKQFEHYYNLLKNKNLTKITEQNLNPGKISFQVIGKLLRFLTKSKKKLNNHKNTIFN